MTAVERVRAEYVDDALGVATPTPRLTWWITTDDDAWRQVAAEIRIESVDRSETHRIEGERSVFVDWPAAPLGSRERASVRVRVQGPDTNWTAWSDPLLIEAPLIDPSDWIARPIAHPAATDSTAAQYFRHDFELDHSPENARLYATSFGVHVCEINGRSVADHLLEPGWSNYRRRIRFRTHDVTHLLRRGDNTIGLVVAEGWYRGRLGFEGGRREIYGDRVGPLAQLEVSGSDGRRVTIATGSGWKVGSGCITATSLYDGEQVEGADVHPSWSMHGFDDAGWLDVDVLPSVANRLEPAPGPPIRVTETLPVADVGHAPSGSLIVDFGQNIAGRIRIEAPGTDVGEVTVRHAEVLDGGELGVRPLRSAAQTDRYRGVGGEMRPTFSLHGFRYAEVDGIDAETARRSMTAEVCHSDMLPTGRFRCSHRGLERLHENARWSMRGNFIDIPTDCPQRDERMGWTGDIQIFAPAACFLYDCNGFLASWMRDLTIEQQELGTVPAYVPWFETIFAAEPSAAWGDAAVVVPWTLYERFGDVDVLRRHYEGMCAWVDQIADIAGPAHIWRGGLQFGDWVDPTAPADRPAAGRTEPELVATAYHARSTRLLARAAAVIGRQGDAERYARLADEIDQAFRNEYVTPAGRLANDSPTAHALAICFSLVTGAQRQRAGDRLAELVQQDDHHIGTGFVGTPLVCDALTGTGHVDTAYHLLLQDTCPSWLYPVTQGATTIWERWDSMLPDGSINPGWMTSFNHYALGAVVDFLHRVVAGLAPAEAGYRQLNVDPRPGGGLTWAEASLHTPYGQTAVEWSREGSTFELIVEVPANSSAVVRLPDGQTSEFGAGRHRVVASCRPAEEDPVRPARRPVGPELP